MYNYGPEQTPFQKDRKYLRAQRYVKFITQKLKNKKILLARIKYSIVGRCFSSLIQAFLSTPIVYEVLSIKIALQ